MCNAGGACQERRVFVTANMSLRSDTRNIGLSLVSQLPYSDAGGFHVGEGHEVACRGLPASRQVNEIPLTVAGDLMTDNY